jgi:hypothetical protein
MRAISSGHSTTGKRFVLRGRSRPDIQGRSTPSTLPYRNSNADSAWLCVDAETLRLFVSQDRKSSTSGLPISAGCRRSWKWMNARAQCT